MASSRGRIDTHAHFIPAFWRESCMKNGQAAPDGMPCIPPWSVEEHLDFMRKGNITKSILSITSPGTNLNPHDAAACEQLTRECNEYAADLKKRYPSKFGFWASLPLPDVEASLQEIDHSLDALNADGFIMLTNYHGVYLGDSSLDPVFEYLNRRKATVFIHPTAPCQRCNDQSQPASPLPAHPSPMFEFFFDTARASINLFASGTVAKYPDVTFILSHAGGALTPLIARFSNFSRDILSGSADLNKVAVVKALNEQFYFDLAGFVFPEQIHGLLPYVDADRITYGSDYPLTPEPAALQLLQQADVHVPKLFPDTEKQSMIWKDNASKIVSK